MWGKIGIPEGVLVDDDVEVWASKFRWRIMKSTKTSYVRRHVSGETRSEFLHREVLGLEPGDGRKVDHINGNGLDNRRANLRIVDHALNQLNRIGIDAKNTSGFRGVYFRNGKWFAKCSVSKRQHYLGTYDTREAAAEAVRVFLEPYDPAKDS
jgi:hypothetical protein